MHYVDLTARRHVTSTLGPHTVHFVDLASHAMSKSTLCTLTEAKLPTLPTCPTQPQLTLTSLLTFVNSAKRPELDSNQRPTP